MVTQPQIEQGLRDIGVTAGMSLEVHSSLSSFGQVEGGAEAVIGALKSVVTEQGSIFMPSLRLSKELELTEQDKAMGITVKIKVLEPDCERSAMGIIADTFRKMPDTYTGDGVFRISGWGRHGADVITGGLDYPLHNGGMALLLGVDIYKLTAMHYVESLIPDEINSAFATTEEIDKVYPPEEWFVEAGHPPVKAWYTIQRMAYEKGLIKDGYIGECKVMFFKIWDVVGLYEQELKRDPLGLYGMK